MTTLLIIVLVVGLAVGFLYNKLVSLRNRVEEGLSGIDVQLKKRYDLIPNLVNTVKGYATHESGTFENVIKARNQAMEVNITGDANAKAAVESQLSGTLKSLFALAENYPDLKANTSFLDLQKNLADIEENLSNSRRYYNALVRDNNIAVESFPSNVVANYFSFRQAEYFEIEDSNERSVPEVKF